MMVDDAKAHRDIETALKPNRVRRVKSRYFTKPTSLVRSNAQLNTQLNAKEWTLERLMRISFESPIKDYIFVRELLPNQGTVISSKKTIPFLAVLRESHSISPLQMLEMASHLCHPNIADVRDAYYHEEKLYIVSEYLEVSLLDVDFNLYPLEEWEIATIITEVLTGLRYLSNTLDDDQLVIDTIQLSLKGDVKLVLDLSYWNGNNKDRLHVSSKVYNIEFLAEVVKAMIPWNKTAGTQKVWSKEAIDFLSLPILEQMDLGIKHEFLSKAVSSKMLVERVRFMRELLLAR